MKHIADQFGDDPDGAIGQTDDVILAEGDIWLWQSSEPGSATAWHFLTIKEEAADQIRHRSAGARGGFGSVKVTATIGGTTWRTSVFPSKDAGGYLLPLKADVRKKEKLVADMKAIVSLSLQ